MPHARSIGRQLLSENIKVEASTLDVATTAVVDTIFDDAVSDPLIDGTVADGTEKKAARKDHVHPKHHTQSHNHASAGDGTSLVPATLQVTGTADVESHMTVGNGSALIADRTLIIDRDFSTTGLPVQLDLRGEITVTGGTSNIYGLRVSPSAVFINSGGAHTNVASAIFTEPVITETSGSVINAMTVYIFNAPTEGDNNYALFVDAGATRLDGELEFGNGVAVVAGNYSIQRDADGTNQLHLNVPTGAKLEFSVNDVAQMLLGASTLTGNVVGTGSSQVAVGNHTHAGSNVISAIKGADETVNNSITFQNDDDLTFSVAANDEWLVVYHLFVNSGTTPDIKFQFSVPTSASYQFVNDATFIAGISPANAMAEDTAFSVETSSGTLDHVLIIVKFLIGANAGSVVLQWAQSVQDVSDTKVLRGSGLIGWNG